MARDWPQDALENHKQDDHGGAEREALIAALNTPTEAHWVTVSHALERYEALPGSIEVLRERVRRATAALGGFAWRGDSQPLERLLAFLGRKADEMLNIDE